MSCTRRVRSASLSLCYALPILSSSAVHWPQRHQHFISTYFWNTGTRTLDNWVLKPVSYLLRYAAPPPPVVAKLDIKSFQLTRCKIQFARNPPTADLIMIVIRRQILHQELERVQARFEPDRRHRRHRRRRRRRLVVNGVLHTITESALQLKIHWSNFLKEKKVVFSLH